MAFTVQDDTGTVTGANAYVTVAYFKAYHTERGNSYAGKSDADIEKAIIKATDYVDARFRFRGVRQNNPDTQLTAWPRFDVTDDDGSYVNGIPTALERAVSEYAFRALSGSLMSDPVAADTSGRGVKRVSKTVGPLSKSTEYLDSTTLQLPRYPAADRMLAAAGLLLSGTTLARG